MTERGEGPLAGLRVLELAGVLAGPLVGQFCAELGADVIKVEPPGGDVTRGWLLADEDPAGDVSAYFSCANRGKRSIALDLADPGGRAFALALARRSDVVISAFRPGAAARLGMDAARSAASPRAILLEVNAYGENDPRPGFDAIVQAEGGFLALNGEPGGPPLKMPVALMDVLAAHQLKQGLLLALLRRERTGEGARVTTSLLATAAASLANQAAAWLHAGIVPRRMGSDHPTIVPYGTVYATRDGRELVLAAGTDRQFRAGAEAVGAPELGDDPRFADNAARVRHRDELQRRLRAGIAAADADELVAALAAAGVPCGFVHPMDRVFEQPEARAQQFADGRGARSVALRGDVEGARDLAPAPALDAHGDAIRAECARPE